MTPAVAETDVPAPREPSRRAGRHHVVFAVMALLCVAAFGWMLTFGTGRFLVADSFGNFFDYQAQAWLHGRWSVPEPALSGEAFIVGGKVYGYFGPTPALMRLPLVAAGIGFGELTRPFMLLDYVGCLIAAYLILLDAARRRGGPPSPWLVAAYTGSLGLGSTLFFLGSRAYVYHEAILCGAAFGLFATWCALRYLAAPASRWWIGAAVCGIFAVQARPPIGLFALTLLGVVALNHAIAQRRWAPLTVGVVAALGVLSFNAVSYIKFDTWEGCPLRLNVQYTPERLASFGGRNFHLGNLRFNADSYLLIPSASLQPHFPYVFLEYLDRKKYPESRMAYRDPTLAIPYAMPGLVFLAVVGTVVVAVGSDVLRRPLALLWIAVIPMAFAMLIAVSVTQRYTADFCPFLIAAAACGGVTLDHWRRSWRRVAATIAGVLAVTSAALQGAITLHQQRAVVWGVPAKYQQQYQRWQRQIDAFFGDKEPH